MNDAILRAAACEVRDAMLSSLPTDCPHYEASPRFEKRMERLLADPVGYAKRMTRTWYQSAVQGAAMLAATLGLSALLLSQLSPTAWAAVKQWFMEIRASDIVYYFTGETQSKELPYYFITDLPEEYAPTGEVVELTGYRSITYANADRQPLYFNCSFMNQGSALGIDSENMKIHDISINGCQGQVFLSLDAECSNAVIWIDEGANIQFTIDAYESETVLLHMAESVSLVKTAKP